jgi:hypothetical protein
MKYLPVIILFAVTSAMAQPTNYAINFNNYITASDNDFNNFFNGNTGLFQDTLNGITGGSLATPDSNNWGNDNAVFCSQLSGAIAGNTFATSLCFYYDSGIINANSYDRAASIWFEPSADFNHYIIGSVTHAGKIQIMTYSNVVDVTPPALVNHHWYKLSITVHFNVNPQLLISGSLQDLGTTGQTSGVTTSINSPLTNDSVFYNDLHTALSITGSRWGGAARLDDFHCNAWMSTNACPVTSSIESTDEPDYKINYNASGILFIKSNSNTLYNVRITNAIGKTITLFEKVKGDFETKPDLAAGAYIISAEQKDRTFTKKILVTTQ